VTGTRERILDAAIVGFAERGVEATSLDALAERLQVRKQTILYHFGSKDGLLVAAIDHAVSELAQALRRAASRRSTSDERTRDIVDSVLRLGARRPDLLVLLREVSRLGPPVSHHLAAAIEPLVDEAVASLSAVGVDPAKSRRVLLTAGAKVVGLATETEVLRDLGIPPDVAALRQRRRELLDYLTGALS